MPVTIAAIAIMTIRQVKLYVSSADWNGLQIAFLFSWQGFNSIAPTKKEPAYTRRRL